MTDVLDDPQPDMIDTVLAARHPDAQVILDETLDEESESNE